MDSTARSDFSDLDDWAKDAEKYASERIEPPSKGKRKPPAKAARQQPTNPIKPKAKTRQINLEGEEDGPPIPLADKPNAIPVSLLRSALFTIRKHSETTLERCEIHSQSGVRVIYEGPLLNQHDKLVWATALRLAKQSGKSMNSLFEVSKRLFLSEMGWSGGGSNMEWVWESLVKLSKASITIDYKSKDGAPKDISSICGNLLGVVMHGDARKHFAFRFIPELLPQLAAAEIHADIHFIRRSMLKSQIAQWVHDFYSTHSGDSALPVSSIRDLCGASEDYTEWDFRLRLRKAISEIKGLPDIFDSEGNAIPKLFETAEVRRDPVSREWKLDIKLGKGSTRVHHPKPIQQAAIKPMKKSQARKPGGLVI